MDFRANSFFTKVQKRLCFSLSIAVRLGLNEISVIKLGVKKEKEKERKILGTCARAFSCDEIRVSVW